MSLSASLRLRANRNHLVVMVGCFVAAVVCFGLWTVQLARADWVPDCTAPTQTFTDGGTAPANLNVPAGAVILFTGGTYTGNVNGSLGRICVDTGAAFNPGTI